MVPSLSLPFSGSAMRCAPLHEICMTSIADIEHALQIGCSAEGAKHRGVNTSLKHALLPCAPLPDLSRANATHPALCLRRNDLPAHLQEWLEQSRFACTATQHPTETLSLSQDVNGPDPRKRMRRFLDTLYSGLLWAACAVLQIHREKAEQASSLTTAAMWAGFSGGPLIDLPHGQCHALLDSNPCCRTLRAQTHGRGCGASSTRSTAA